MIYDLRHRTTYSYESPVSFARCVLRLTPQTSARQTILENSVAVTPWPTNFQERIGAFNERILSVVVETTHEELVIEARSRVDVHDRGVDPSIASPAWADVRSQALSNLDLGADGPATYLYPTKRAPIIPAITDYARLSFAIGRPILSAIADLMSRMHADFAYDPKSTDVSTPPQEAFAARRGVCQDFAHIMISGLRGLGLPAAYVSGYLRTVPPPGQPRLEGADATHAWVNAWCGDAVGWVGVDPTNDMLVANDHIVLAMGRDYSDVAPIDGIILAPGAQTQKVEVDVLPDESIDVVDGGEPSLPGRRSPADSVPAHPQN